MTYRPPEEPRLTPTAKTIMDVFRYYRTPAGNNISVKQMQENRHLWRDVDDETFYEAIDDLVQRDFIAVCDDPPGWQLLKAGEMYIVSRR
jgi:hypothetical protein